MKRIGDTLLILLQGWDGDHSDGTGGMNMAYRMVYLRIQTYAYGSGWSSEADEAAFDEVPPAVSAIGLDAPRGS